MPGWQLLVSDDPSQEIYTVDQRGVQTWLYMMGRTPSWTPEGKVIYVWTGESQPKIFIAPPTWAQHGWSGSSIVPTPPWPDIVKPQQVIVGGPIVFAADNAIWKVDPNGTGLTPLSSGAAPAGAPYLAPNGQWLTYTEQTEDGLNQVWAVNIDGSNRHQLTFENTLPGYSASNASAILPQTSPTTQGIAVFTGTESGPGRRDIALMSYSGDPRTVITRCGVPLPFNGQGLSADNPFVLPQSDGTFMIGFDLALTDGKTSVTAAINPDGTGLRTIWRVGRGSGAYPARLVA